MVVQGDKLCTDMTSSRSPRRTAPRRRQWRPSHINIFSKRWHHSPIHARRPFLAQQPLHPVHGRRQNGLWDPRRVSTARHPGIHDWQYVGSARYRRPIGPVRDAPPNHHRHQTSSVLSNVPIRLLRHHPTSVRNASSQRLHDRSAAGSVGVCGWTDMPSGGESSSVPLHRIPARQPRR